MGLSMKYKEICILGLGYIGLPTACMFATHGIKVHGVDINEDVINSLKSGLVHIVEPGLEELFHSALNSGNLLISSSVKACDAFIIAVPTPFKENKKADMKAVIAACEAITPHLREGNLVMLESTSPPRTTEDLVKPILESTGLKAGIDFHLAYSPERVLPGQIISELVNNARIIGGINPESSGAGKLLYQNFVKGEIHCTTATTAEMTKLMENTYRDVNIAIANEFCKLADRFGIDVWEAIKLSNLHPRVNILNPGPGVGGHCISVDPWFLVEAAPDITNLISQARIVNDSQPQFVVNSLRKKIGIELLGKKIAILGLSYKPEVDDLRESPAVEVAHLLTKEGASVKCYEPFKPHAKINGLDIVPSLELVVDDADVIVILVGHKQFGKISPDDLLKITKARAIFDTVHCLDDQNWKDRDFVLHRLGVNKSD